MSAGAGHGGQPEAGRVHPAQPAVGARALAAGRAARAPAITARSLDVEIDIRQY